VCENNMKSSQMCLILFLIVVSWGELQADINENEEIVLSEMKDFENLKLEPMAQMVIEQRLKKLKYYDGQFDYQLIYICDGKIPEVRKCRLEKFKTLKPIKSGIRFSPN